MGVKFGILGALDVQRDGEAVELGGAKRRALVAYLLVHAGQSVRAEAICDAIWPDTPSSTATKTVQTYLSKLRRDLPGVRLSTTPMGYRLDVGTDDLDASRFEAAVDSAASLVPDQAADALLAALDDWRGPALVEFAGRSWAAPTAVRLDQLRLVAEDLYFDAELACGRHEAVLPRLEAASLAEPLREARQAKLMVALYRAGQQSEALRAYGRLRAQLLEQLGVDPSPELAALETAVLRQDVGLAPAAAAVSRRPPAGAVEPGGGRRTEGALETVSVVFTDLVDSTATMLALPRTEADTVRSEFYDVQRRVVVATGGEEIKSTGDGLMVVYTNLAGALRAAVGIQQALERRNRRARVPLHLRVGLSIGDAVRQSDDYYGATVIEAARLCQAAQPGQVLATDLVRLLSGPQSEHRFKPAGELALKGLDPVVATEVVWDLDGGSPLPLPPTLAAASPTDFVGRRAERERLEEAMRRVDAGGAAVVLVSGEPGIGKTRLAQHAAAGAAAQGAVVLLGRCDEDLGAPFHPFVDALDFLVANAPSALLVEHVAQHGGELVRVVPRLAERVPGLPPARTSDAETERFALFRAVGGLLAGLAREQSVVLLLDDLHWADRQSDLLLRYLAADHIPGLLILGTFRSSETDESHPLIEVLAQLHRQVEVERIELSGLGQAELVELMEAAAGHELGADGRALARSLSIDTDGNPFFVFEILRHLFETGQIARTGDRWAMARELEALNVPQGVRAVVLQRVGRLGEGCRQLLSTASVIGRVFELDLLAEVAGQPVTDVLDALERADRAQLVHEVAGRQGSFTFAHALVERALYEAQSAARRAAVHNQTAVALDRRAAAGLVTHPTSTAFHWIEGFDEATRPRAVAAAEAAGNHAVAQLAPYDAAGWYARALEVLTSTARHDVREEAELLVALAQSQRSAGLDDYRPTVDRAMSVASSLGDGALVARAALAGFGGMWTGHAGVDERQVEIYETALRALGDEDSPLAARVLAALAVELVYDEDAARREELGSRSVAMARRVGDPAALVVALQAYDDLVHLPDRWSERAENVRELTELADQLGDPVQQFWAMQRSAVIALEGGDADTYYDAVAELEERAERTGQPYLHYVAGFMAIEPMLLRGDFEAAEQAVFTTYELGMESGQPGRARAVLAAMLWRLRRDQGRLDEIVEVLEGAVASNPGIPAFRPALGIAYIELDRDDGRAMFEVDAADAFERYPRNTLWFGAMALNAEIAAHYGDAAAAAVLYGVLLPFADQLSWTAACTNGAVARQLGLAATTLGRFEEADAHFASAHEIHERFDAPVWLVRTDVEWAAMLARRRRVTDLDRAARLLEGADAEAARLGLDLLRRRSARVADELAAVTARPR